MLKMNSYKYFLHVVFSFILISSCTKNNDLSYHLYDKNGFIKVDGKFKSDQFIDTIYIYKETDSDIYNDHFNTFIKIDSSKNNFFYGTEIIEEKNTHKLFSKGMYRFKKSNNAKECYESKLRTGYFIIFNRDGSLNSRKLYQIKGDSSYIIKRQSI